MQIPLNAKYKLDISIEPIQQRITREEAHGLLSGTELRSLIGLPKVILYIYMLFSVSNI